MDLVTTGVTVQPAQFPGSSQGLSQGSAASGVGEESQGRNEAFLGAVHSSRNGMSVAGLTSPDMEKERQTLNPLTFGE